MILLGLPLLGLASPVRAEPTPEEDTRQAPPADGARSTAGSCGPGRPGCFRDVDGSWRNAHLSYEIMQMGLQPDYLRTVGEMALFLGIGTAWYWIERDKNAFDWDFSGWRQRFTRESYTYDNNPFATNFMGHALSGATYYGMSRANDLNVFASFASAFLSSWIWEFVIEFKERVSINDQIVTPAAGLVLGEFLHRLARYVNSAPGGGGKKHKALKWTVGLGVAFHDWMDGKGPPHPDQPVDERGFTSDIAARFRLAYGAGLARPSDGADFAVHELGFDGTLVAIPGYLKPGQFGRFFADANVTSLRMRLRFAAEGFGAELDGDTVLLGFHRQDIRQTARGLRGEALTVGTNMSYLYRRERYDDFVDRLAIVGLPGLSVDAHLFTGQAMFRLGARLNGDFASPHSEAFSQWDEQNAFETPKTILRREQYFYGWGGTAKGYAELRLPYLELGAAIRYGAWRSQQGLDRQQTNVTIDTRARERAFDWETWLRIMPFDLGVFLEVMVEGRQRWSWVETFTDRRQLTRYQVSLGLLN
jgi:hypothetical protein